MGQIDNLNQGQLASLVSRIEKLERAAPMNNAAIGRGGILVYDGGVITIENGGLNVTGTATISGVLNADGTVTLSGTVAISGPLTVTGATHLNGATDIAGNTTVTGDLTTNGPMKTTGTLSVEGVTTLKNDLNVTTGKIVAGAVTIDPATLGGVVKFAGGATLAAIGSALVITSPLGISIQDNVSMSHDVFLAGIPTTTNPPNLYADPTTGQIKRSTA